MKRLFRLFRLNRDHTANSISFSIAAFAILALHLESSPTPAGANVARRVAKQMHVISPNLVAGSAMNGGLSGSAGADAGQEEITGEDLNAKIQILERGLKFLTTTPDYTAQFVKQELVNGELLDEQEMELKVRHAPFSVYMKWVTGEVGREVLYVDGHNDGKITAHGGGWKARLPSVSLDPSGSMAMAESRHPITKVGLYSLTQMMLDIHRQDLEKENFSRFERLKDQVFDGRPCYAFLIEYKDRQASEHYRKSITLIDKQYCVPVHTKNYGWLNGQAPADPDQHDEATLLEYYSYANIRFRPNLVAMDFDSSNEDYGFKRQ